MRPAGSPPRFASDDLYDSPGKPWDNTDTKRIPSAGIVAQGRVPGTKAVAQHENYIHDAVREFAIYQDTIEVQNWSAPHGFLITAGWTPVLACAWEATDGKFLFGAEDSIASNKRGDAETWVAETLPGSGPTLLKFIVAEDTTVSGAVVAGGGTYAGFLKYTAGVWALVATAGTIQYRSATIWNPPGGGYRFMLGAESLSAHAAIVSLATNMTTTSVHTQTLPSGYTSGGITHLISCQTNALSMAIAISGGDDAGAGAGGLQTYTSTDAVTWTGNRITGITNAISDAWYDAEREAFYILDNVGNLYKSTNGTTWTDTGTDVPIDTGKINVLACMGGTWVSVLSSNRLGFSVDEGATWRTIPYLFDDAAGGQPYDLRGARALVGDGRFVVLANPASDTKSQEACFSLRLR